MFDQFLNTLHFLLVRAVNRFAGIVVCAEVHIRGFLQVLRQLLAAQLVFTDQPFAGAERREKRYDVACCQPVLPDRNDGKLLRGRDLDICGETDFPVSGNKGFVPVQGCVECV